MHNVPTANALTQRVGVPVAPVEVGRYFVGEIVKEKRSIKSVGRSYMAGNLHRPAYVELDVTFKISGLTYTRRAALKLGRPQDHETGAKVFVYVNTIVVPHIQSAREAILLRGQGNSPDAVITAVRSLIRSLDFWYTDLHLLSCSLETLKAKDGG